MTQALFDWAVNRTKILQGFVGWVGTTMVSPGVLVDLATLDQAGGDVLEHVKPPLKYFEERGIPEFFLQRTFSLGDILQLVPVARYLRTLGWKVWIRTIAKYVPLLRLLGEDVLFTENATDMPGVLFDNEVERDHYDPALQKMHRVHIYARALGLKELPKEWDWAFDPEKFPHVETPEKYIMFQGRGATVYRGLPNVVIEATLESLVEKGVKVVYIGEQTSLDVPESVTLFYQKLSLPELFSWMFKAAAVVSCDSSPLWISHYTCTPVVAMLGPSRPTERIVLHPLFPEGAVCIRLNEWIKCESCFEEAEVCEGTFKCLLNVDTDRAVSEITENVMKFWEIDR